MKLVTFTRLEGGVVAINPQHVVAVRPGNREASTVIVTTALTSFSASSGSTNFVVACPLESVVEMLS